MTNTEDDDSTNNAADHDSPLNLRECLACCVDIVRMGVQLAVWKITTHLLPHSVKRVIVGTAATALPRSIGVPLLRFVMDKRDARDWTED